MLPESRVRIQPRRRVEDAQTAHRSGGVIGQEPQVASSSPANFLAQLVSSPTTPTMRRSDGSHTDSASVSSTANKNEGASATARPSKVFVRAPHFIQTPITLPFGQWSRVNELENFANSRQPANFGETGQAGQAAPPKRFASPDAKPASGNNQPAIDWEKDARRLLEEAAHEILAPLAVARQLLDAVCETTSEPNVRLFSQQRRFVQVAQGRMEQASLWAENILAWRRLLQSSSQEVRQRFYPEQWRKRAQPLIDRIASSHGVTVQWTGWERSLPKLYLPAEHLTRIVMNLVINAAMASSRGQTVSVRVGWQTTTTQSLVIAIEDQGIGAPDEVLDFINSPAIQSESKLLRARNGIGLQAVKSLVLGMGGTISARRAQEGDVAQAVGTIVRLALPVDDRLTLVRGWLERQLRSNREQPNFGRRPLAVQLFMIGHPACSRFESRDGANQSLHEMSDGRDFIYRVNEGRWLWLSTREQLPSELITGPWQHALAARWEVNASLVGEQRITTSARTNLPQELNVAIATYLQNSSQAQALTLTRLSRTIAETMDRLLGKRVPPLDKLSGEVGPARMLQPASAETGAVQNATGPKSGAQKAESRGRNPTMGPETNAAPIHRTHAGHSSAGAERPRWRQSPIECSSKSTL